MSAPSVQQVLRLYRDLLRYGQQLKLTDKAYFYRRVRTEFEKARDVQEDERKRFLFELSKKPVPGVDRSRYPVLLEEDLEEHFVRGSGPGGQSVNTTANSVALKHTPSGLVVKCHESRSLDRNRRRAREILADQLDDLLNGEESVAAQTRRIQDARSQKKQDQRRRRLQRKMKWKEREGIT